MATFEFVNGSVNEVEWKTEHILAGTFPNHELPITSPEELDERKTGDT